MIVELICAIIGMIVKLICVIIGSIVTEAPKLVPIATLFGVGMAIFQLEAVRKNTKINVLKTEFDIFGKISEKEMAFVDAYEEYEKWTHLGDKTPRKMESFNSYVKNREQYLNDLNLLCLYIDEGYFTKEHFFLQYGKKISSMYDQMKKSNEIRKYIHIETICQKYEKELRKIASTQTN